MEKTILRINELKEHVDQCANRVVAVLAANSMGVPMAHQVNLDRDLLLLQNLPGQLRRKLQRLMRKCEGSSEEAGEILSCLQQTVLNGLQLMRGKSYLPPKDLPVEQALKESQFLLLFLQTMLLLEHDTEKYLEELECLKARTRLDGNMKRFIERVEGTAPLSGLEKLIQSTLELNQLLEEILAGDRLEETDLLKEILAGENLKDADQLEEVIAGEQLEDADQLEEVIAGEQLEELDSVAELEEWKRKPGKKPAASKNSLAFRVALFHEFGFSELPRFQGLKNVSQMQLLALLLDGSPRYVWGLSEILERGFGGEIVRYSSLDHQERIKEVLGSLKRKANHSLLSLPICPN